MPTADHECRRIDTASTACAPTKRIIWWDPHSKLWVETIQKKRADIVFTISTLRIHKPFRAASVIGSFLIRYWLSASGSGIARGHWSLLRCKRSGNNCIRTNQTYHQDYHPDRTFHGLFLLECG